MAELEARRVIDEIRASMISAMGTRVAQSLHSAVELLAAELYQKDLHFVMELVQNADDNQYPVGAVPELEFVMVNSDIAKVGGGVESTLLVLNNEVGFSRANVESLCSVGCSTKKGKRSSGFVGEKGIGFKSVFTVTRHPIVISNGYRFRFCDAPMQSSGFGYIVPEWVEHPTPECLSLCVGKSLDELPKTILALPLRPEKVSAVRSQLCDLSPYLVLFLNQIDKLSTRVVTLEGSGNALSVNNADVGMSVQRRLLAKPSQQPRNGAGYSHISLSSATKELAFHVFDHKFPLSPSEHEVEHRKDVLSRTITLAFPVQNNNLSDAESISDEFPSLFSFLPTKVDTAFPFVINADFLLVSSRETIRLDSRWNKGILSHIPEAFIESFIFLLKKLKPSGQCKGVANMETYQYIPLGRTSTMTEFKVVREEIIDMLKSHDTVLCEVEKLGQLLPNIDGHPSFFCKPSQVRTMDPSFRFLLKKAHKAGIPAPELLRTHTVFIVDRKLEKRYHNQLSVLGVRGLSDDHYVQCVKSSSVFPWLASLPEEIYVDLLYFISIKAGGGNNEFSKQLKVVPLFKYVEKQGNGNLIKFFSASEKDKHCVYLNPSGGNFLSNWSFLFSQWLKVDFIPVDTFKAFENLSNQRKQHLTSWLETFGGIKSSLTVEDYGMILLKKCEDYSYYNDRAFILNTFQFFLHASSCGELALNDTRGKIGNVLPLIDNYNQIITPYYRVSSYQNLYTPKYKYVLLPVSVCNGPKDIIQNSWEGHVMSLSGSYLQSTLLSGYFVSRDSIVSFLRVTINAVNISEVSHPPNVPLSIMDNPAKLSRQDVASLLEWLNGLSNLPDKLTESFSETKWVKTVRHGYTQPRNCVLNLSSGGWNSYFKEEDLPVVDKQLYGGFLDRYKDLLGSKFGMVLNAYNYNGVNMISRHISRIAAERNIVSRDTARRWYRYLRDKSWMGWSSYEYTCKALIWIPDPYPGKWMCAKDCVVRDKGGLFGDRLVVLSEYYEEDVLAFFQSNMGVAQSPGTKAYSELWLDWCKTLTAVEKKKCQTVWKIMTEDWENLQVSNQSFAVSCKIPCAGGDEEGEEVRLINPKEVLYGDNLILAELFKDKGLSSAKPKFAWYPRSAAEAKWVEKLVNKCYMDVGVKMLSKVVEIANVISVRKPSIQKGLYVGRGLARVLLGYLADVKRNVEVNVRKTMVSQLLNVQICHVEELGQMTYNLRVDGKLYSASRAACVNWDKNVKRIYVLNLGNKEITSSINRLQLAMEMSAEIAKGVVGGTYQALVEGLQQLLLLAAGFDFEDASAKLLINVHNLRLTLEDEALLGMFPDHPCALFRYK